MPLPPVGGSGLSSKVLASTGNLYSTLPDTKVNRTAVYNDGYNLFNAIFDIGWFDAIWVDLELLGQALAARLPGNPRLTMFNHFTARPCNNPKHISPKADPEVFNAFVSANSVSSRVTVIRGAFVHRSHSHEEKQSDVNLAYQLTADAYQDAFDSAVIISGDTDFLRLIRTLSRTFPQKSFVIASPPGRTNRLAQRLEGEGLQQLKISKEMLLTSQLPPTVVDPKSNERHRAPSQSFWQG